LYTYDAILFDVNEEDENIVEQLKGIMSEKGRYPVKLKESKNLVL